MRDRKLLFLCPSLCFCIPRIYTFTKLFFKFYLHLFLLLLLFLYSPNPNNLIGGLTMKCSTVKIPNITNRKLVSPRRTIGSNIFSKVLFISKNAPLVEVLQPQQNLILYYTPSAFYSIHYETLLPQDL